METSKEQWRYAGILTLLIVCALFLAARVVYLFVADPIRFPINTIKITANHAHISHEQLQTILSGYEAYSFFSLPVSTLKKELLQLEWSDEVAVERVWPDTLKIKLTEKLPVAFWNNALISAKGEVFNEGGEIIDRSLPFLKGPINQSQYVLQVYQKLSKILSEYGLYAAGLEWRDNGAWELVLSTGSRVRLGKQHLTLRIKRFCKAYPTVFAERADELGSVDLRYPRGMAVEWKNKQDKNG